MNPKLFMLLLGATPADRFIEQHDVFFTIGTTLKDLVPSIRSFWPEGKGLHIDAWREVTFVDGYNVEVITAGEGSPQDHRLFFLNLGGYKKNEFEEFHYKMIVAAKEKGTAIAQAKQTAFYKHTGFKGAESHIDDKYGIDVDDVYAIDDILPEVIRAKYQIILTPTKDVFEDIVQLGYFKLDKI